MPWTAPSTAATSCSRSSTRWRCAAAPARPSSSRFQGEVEYRRGDGGDWQEARSRVQLPAGRLRADGGQRLGRDHVPGRHALHGAPQHPVHRLAGQRRAEAAAAGAVDRDEVRLGQPEHLAGLEQRQDAGRRGAGQGVVGGLRRGRQGDQPGSLRRLRGEHGAGVQGRPEARGRRAPAGGADGRPALRAASRCPAARSRPSRWTTCWSTSTRPSGWCSPGSRCRAPARYALQVSRNHLFVDNVIDAENRAKTRATLGVRGEGTFQWRVAAFGADGLQGPWSEPRKFRVAAAVRSAGGGGSEKGNANPPALDLDEIKTYGSIFMVGGHSEPGARVEVNGEQVKTNADGSFTKTVQLTKEGWNIIEVRARERLGHRNRPPPPRVRRKSLKRTTLNPVNAPAAAASSGVAFSRRIRKADAARLAATLLLQRPGHRSRHRQHPGLRQRPGHRGARALRRRHQQDHQPHRGRRQRGQGDARPHARATSSRSGR